MQTTRLLETKKEITNKLDNLLDSTLAEISGFYQYLKDLRANIVDEREGLDEMDEYGEALDNLLLQVEEAQAILTPYNETLEEVQHKLDIIYCQLAKDIEHTEQTVAENQQQIVSYNQKVEI